MENSNKSFSGRVIRILAAVAGVVIIAWTLLFSNIHPRVSVFELVSSAEANDSGYGAGELSRLRLLTRCIGYIRSGYVVPDRVKPMPMMAGALKAAEGVVPDLMVTFSDPDPDKATSVEVRVGDLTKVFPLEHMDDLYQVNWRLQDIFEFISKNLPSDIKPEDVEYAAINGLLEPLDEHSMFLPPEAYQQMQLDTQGRFGGLGIVISSRGGYVTVMSVMDETPAKAQGLRTGDRIVDIDNESTMNMPLTDAVSRLRGEPGSEVTILIDRTGWSEPRTVTLTRAVIKVASVKTESLGNGIGYARLMHFQEDTAEDLARQLTNLRDAGSLKGLVLDLRQNPGGLLDQAVSVGDLFLGRGTLVVTQGESNRMRQEYDASTGESFEGLPVVVLVDGGSASAAEIVAGALKYNNRAMLLGTTTYGKGTVQVMHEVGDGALKLTVAQYLIPGDLSIQGVGVVPDLELVPTLIGRNNIVTGLPDYRRFKDPDRLLDAFGRIAEDIPADFIPYLAKPTDGLDDDNDELTEPPVKDETFERDEAMDLAATILAATPGLVARNTQLDRSRAAVMAWKSTHDSDISQAFAGRLVDWSSGPVVMGPLVSTTFAALEDSPSAGSGNAAAAANDGWLVAGTSAILTMTVTNRGVDPLFRVRCAARSDNPQLDGREFIFGRVDPGATETRSVRFKVPRETWERRDQVELSLYQNGTDRISDLEPVYVAFKPVAHPRFGFTAHVIDAGGNGDGVLNPGENADVVFETGNVGNGGSSKVMVSLGNKSGERLYLRSGRETLADGLPAGGTSIVRFSVQRRQDTDVEPIKVEFSVLDLAIREYLSEEITLPSSGSAGPQFTASARKLQASRAQVSVLAAAADGARVLMVVPEGTTMKSDGYFPGYYRVEMNDGLWGFVLSTDVIDSPDPAAQAGPLDPVALTNVAPLVDVTFTPVAGVQNAVRVAGTVEFFDGQADVRRKVLIFRENDKVYFWTRKGPLGNRVVPVDSEVRLQKGRNAIAVYAVEGTDRSSVRRFNFFVDVDDVDAAPVVPSATGTGTP